MSEDAHTQSYTCPPSRLESTEAMFIADDTNSQQPDNSQAMVLRDVAKTLSVAPRDPYSLDWQARQVAVHQVYSEYQNINTMDHARHQVDRIHGIVNTIDRAVAANLPVDRVERIMHLTSHTLEHNRIMSLVGIDEAEFQQWYTCWTVFLDRYHHLRTSELAEPEGGVVIPESLRISGRHSAAVTHDLWQAFHNTELLIAQYMITNSTSDERERIRQSMARHLYIAWQEYVSGMMRLDQNPEGGAIEDFNPSSDVQIDPSSDLQNSWLSHPLVEFAYHIDLLGLALRNAFALGWSPTLSQDHLQQQGETHTMNEYGYGAAGAWRGADFIALMRFDYVHGADPDHIDMMLKSVLDFESSLSGLEPELAAGMRAWALENDL